MIEFSGKEIENFYLKIGENVKRVRKEKNISQMQLALAIGHNSVGHVAKAELCKYDKHFSLEQLYKISRILKVSLHELLPE
ncbi:MAG: helix-turn-helix transcriptional regulator [Sulfurimonas sp.]|nr:helix-turn-helix transcriptional regulator [Sulfurimonas sp.]